MKKLASIIAAVGIVALATGCTSTAIKQGDIVSITERTFGITVAESPTTSSPAVRLGFNSMTVQFTPTSTNAQIYAPNYANTFKIGQAAVPFTFDVDETIASGDYQTGNGTNTSSVPVVPK